MKIVVTGALGHIGSHLIRDLPSQFVDAEIVLIDCLMTQRYASLFNLPAIGRYRFIEADVRAIDLRTIFDGAYVVVHLAAMTDAAKSHDKADLVEANNFEATTNVAHACADTGARLVALSSTSVYGSQDTSVAEDCPAGDLKPQSPYAETKLKEEQLVRTLVTEKGLRAITFRFGTIFGASPGIRFHTAVNKFCWQAAMGQPLTVWRTAHEQKRPYLDLIDAGRLISFVIKRDLFDGRIYNAVTINATVRHIIKTIRPFVPRLKTTFVDSPIMNQLSYEVSARRITEPGFTFIGDLPRGIANTIALLRHANER